MPRLARVVLALAAICQASSTLADEAIVPTGAIRPLTERGLAAFTTWLKETKHEDPKGVFRLENGVLRCGDEDMGYVATKQAYRDYQVSVEYRWGRKRATPTSVRNTGLLLNAVGPDGSAKGLWMTCIECQLAQGCEGDLIVIPGTKADGTKFPATITSDTRVAEDKNTRWDPHGQPTTYSGKQFWWSRHQPFFKEDYDARGRDDVASPVGEWTKVECRCAGARITVTINGQTVNECRDVVPAAGKILLQSEGDEVFFRNLEIRPLPAP